MLRHLAPVYVDVGVVRLERNAWVGSAQTTDATNIWGLPGSCLRARANRTDPAGIWRGQDTATTAIEA